jgi:hypothetical protein
MEVYRGIFSSSLFTMPELPQPRTIAYGLLGVVVMLSLEWINRDRQHGLELDGRAARPVRLVTYYALIAGLILLAPLGGGELIYFQF